jgi:hypothetical protein
VPQTTRPPQLELHPSPRLRELFETRPYQGADPATAKFLFVGSDANFAREIDTTQSFDFVCSYLADGVKFWTDNEVHHPFLLGGYTGSGYDYHDRFRSIGFKRKHASQVSFVEALDIPTCGSGTPPPRWLRRPHLARLEDWVKFGRARYVFMPSTALSLLHRAKTFSWVGTIPIGRYKSLPILFDSPDKTIFSPYHFSYRFAPREERVQQLLDIGSLISDEE